jgi:hypothetical protein
VVAEAAWEGVKAAVPGTDEHAEKRAHQADDPQTGERRTHATAAGAAADQAWTDVKSKLSGGTQTQHTDAGGRSYEDRSADL